MVSVLTHGGLRQTVLKRGGTTRLHSSMKATAAEGKGASKQRHNGTMANNPEYATKKYRTNRAIVLQGNPYCTICGGPGANSADHIQSLMAGGTSDLDNLRPVHKTCNSRRGATEQAKALKQKQQRREQGMQTSNAQTVNNTNEFFFSQRLTPPPTLRNLVLPLEPL